MPGMIVAPQPLAVEEGAKVLMDGGNALDAAVTAAFVQMIVSPHMCGIGGYALLTMHRAGEAGETLLMDAPALAGAQVTADMWEDKIIGPNPDGWGWFLEGKINDLGYQSICTPGTVRGLSTMLERWGTIPWSRALAPAARIAKEGFLVDTTLAAVWQRAAKHPQASTPLEQIKANPEASRIYLREDGTPYVAGDILHNPDYAQTLRHLAQHGADDFYHGELAQRMSSDLAANGSLVTAEDLATYQFRDEMPAVGTYRDYTVATVQSPHGGPTLLAILNILEGYDLSSMEHNSPEYIYLVSMAMKAAFADRNPYMGDPAFVDVPSEWMISKARAAQWQEHINSGAPIHVSFTAAAMPDTTHVTVVDKEGNCVALTHSLGGASSGVITPGLGFMYNNSMINYHPYAGHPNSLAPRKSRTTGMAPAIVYKDDRPVLALGSPGATRIITSNLQVILNVLDFGMDVAKAVHAPRFDCQGDTIWCQTRIPRFVLDEVREKHPIEHIPYSHGGLALVHAITIDLETGALAGGADTGGAGMPLLVA